MRRLVLALLLAVGSTIGVVSTTIVSAEATSTFIFHGPVGNPQGFAITCGSDGSTKWLYQGQYSQDKCPFNGSVNSVYVPANYQICMRDYYGGSGCVVAVGGGAWTPALSGAWYAWTNHVP